MFKECHLLVRPAFYILLGTIATRVLLTPIMVIESAVKSHPIYGNPVGFPRQEVNRVSLPLPTSVQQPWTRKMVSHPSTNQNQPVKDLSHVSKIAIFSVLKTLFNAVTF